MTLRRLVRATVSLAVLLAAACGGTEPIEPSNEPQAVAVVEGNLQSALYGSPLPVQPRVIVSGASGPLVDFPVQFTVELGGGTITGPSARTDASGVATLDGWTLGPTPGENAIRATAGSKSVVMTATAVTGPPTSFVVTAGDDQTATTTQRTAVAPTVQVTDGNFGVQGVTVTFTVTQGDGTVTPSTVVSDTEGKATTVWRMGAGGGTNQITATMTGLPPVAMSAEAVPLVISSFTKLDGDGAVGFANNFADRLPLVELRDQFNRPVEGHAVTFAVQGGGGSVPFAAATTGADGRTSPGAWRFGAAGPQSLSASVPDFPVATFSGVASTTPAGAFAIDLRFLTPVPTADQQAAFLAARDRWQQIIVGDVADYSGNLPADGCGTPGDDTPALPAVTGPVDDIVIFAGIRPIDGPRNILAQAGPCLVRSSNGLTLMGIMIFDVSDLTLLTQGAGLADVATHEMAHVLGFGTLAQWDQLLPGIGGADPHFTGIGARQAFAALQNPGDPFIGNAVPVENTGGSGTRDGHWRESVLNTELMTGFYDAGVNPLSAMSAAAMRDLGYTVDDSRTEAFTLPLRIGSLRSVAAGLELKESLAPWPIREVDLSTGEIRPTAR
jgi:hypothetical protein